MNTSVVNLNILENDLDAPCLCLSRPRGDTDKLLFEYNITIKILRYKHKNILKTTHFGAEHSEEICETYYDEILTSNIWQNSEEGAKFERYSLTMTLKNDNIGQKVSFRDLNLTKMHAQEIVDFIKNNTQ